MSIYAMSEEKEIVITIDAKRLLVLGVITVICVASLYSYIGALFAFIAPSQKFPLRITAAGTFDTSDVSKTSFAIGDTVRIKATVEKATGYYYNSYTYYYPYTYYDVNYYYYYDSVDTTYRIIFAVMDDNNKPVPLKSEVETIWPGQSLVTSYDWTIPSGASTGNYTIRVMAWSDWLPQGDALARKAKEAVFTVSGGG